MVTEAATRSYWYWYIQGSGPQGTLIMLLGFVLFVWGVVNLLLVKNRTVLLLHCLFSYLPLVVALVAIVDASQDYARMAASETAPKPSELAVAVSVAIGCGILGSIATLGSGILGYLSLCLRLRRSGEQISAGSPSA